MRRASPWKTIICTEHWWIINKSINYCLSGSGDDDHDLLPMLRDRSKGQYVHTIYPLPDVFAGLAICVKNHRLYEYMRNMYGSQQYTFTFDIIAKSDQCIDSTVTCSLPIAKHKYKDTMLVSHTTGKKTETTFTIKERHGSFVFLEATTNYLREDQIQLHAFESGIYIYGDEKYAGLSNPDLGCFKKHVKLNRKQEIGKLYTGPCIFLSKVQMPSAYDISYTHAMSDIFSEIDEFYADDRYTFTAPLPDKWCTFQKIIKQWT